MLGSRGLYHDVPPKAQSIHDNKPTLLIAWWCTCFALVIILVRVSGRWIRTEKLFREDKIMCASIIPLMIRMACIHVVLLWGTNNAKTHGLSELQIHHREIGSKLVLVSRIFYAAFIWTAKLTVAEFLKRLTGNYWRTSFEIGLQFIRYFLLVTYIAVVIATLTECHSFSHYWQVVPDPGAKCREGLVQLLTMGICDMMTDILLVAFPIPIVIMSKMPLQRKISLTCLFSLSLALVGITAYRIPSVIDRKGAQQFRSLLASCEILAAAGVANVIVIGSFIRDRGVKKSKFKREWGSASGSTLDRTATLDRTPTRTATIANHHWGSDADLVGDMGMSLAPDLQSRTASNMPRPAPMAEPNHVASGGKVDPNWTFAHGAKREEENDSTSTDSIDREIGDLEKGRTNNNLDLKAALQDDNPRTPPTPEKRKGSDSTLNTPQRKVSFFDVGGLLESNSVPGSLSSQSTHTQDFASAPPQSRKGSRAFLQDVGGLLSSLEEGVTSEHPTTSPGSPTQRRPSQPNVARNFSRGGGYNASARRRSIPNGPPSPIPRYTPEGELGGPIGGPVTGHSAADSMELADAGGLLSMSSDDRSSRPRHGWPR